MISQLATHSLVYQQLYLLLNCVKLKVCPFVFPFSGKHTSINLSKIEWLA